MMKGFNCLSILFLVAFLMVINPTFSIPNHLRTSTRASVISEEGCNSLPVLVCNVSPTEGSNAKGVVYFSPIWSDHPDKKDVKACFTRVRAAMSGLSEGEHGFHIHTYGDLSQTNGKSTGGHFTDPAGNEMTHGLPDSKVRHWGDLGNIEMSDDVAKYDKTDYTIRLGGILGRAMTIHESYDHGEEEQPSGGAGSRVAYGVIGYANPELISV